MQFDESKLNEGERELVRWHYGIQDDFRAALFAAIAHADTTNRIRLWRGFHEYVEAYVMFAERPGYWEDVQRRAGIIPPDPKATEAQQAGERG